MRIIIALVLLASTSLSAAKTTCVSIRITNGYARTVNFANGPVDLVAEVRIDQLEENRYVIVSYDYEEKTAIDSRFDMSAESESDFDLREPDKQDGAVGSEERDLQGAASSVRNDFKLHRLEGGTFVITAVVYDGTKKRSCGRATARVTVR
jgi:hypothetical protein